MARRSKTDRRAHYLALQAGVRKHFARGSELTIASARTSPEEVDRRVQALIEAFDRTEAAYHAWKAALAAERRLERESRPFLRAVGEFVVWTFGPDAQKTRLMGVGRRKTGPKTLASKVRGIRKAEDTRLARKKRG